VRFQEANGLEVEDGGGAGVDRLVLDHIRLACCDGFGRHQREVWLCDGFNDHRFLDCFPEAALGFHQGEGGGVGDAFGGGRAEGAEVRGEGLFWRGWGCGGERWGWVAGVDQAVFAAVIKEGWRGREKGRGGGFGYGVDGSACRAHIFAGWFAVVVGGIDGGLYALRHQGPVCAAHEVLEGDLMGAAGGGAAVGVWVFQSFASSR